MGIRHNHKTRARSSRSPVRKAQKAIARMLKESESAYPPRILLAACPTCDAQPGEPCVKGAVKKARKRYGDQPVRDGDEASGPHQARAQEARRKL